ncbi:hypothetical protein AVEN_146780-1 [Araneus ventricosus]|uniref:Uncharacterized protein n=1 Tax=Araneus ventricosus TaxID=182803 RepID=A0A4Y2D8Z2_ARAVE|nr:hypothetical protein AVEN_146780-1 [Araneus ventricosus]
MILSLILISIALAIQPSFSYPLGIYADPAQAFDISTDFDAYNGPWNYGNRWWGGFGGSLGGYGGSLGGYGGSLGGYGGSLGWGGSRGLWPYDGYVDNWDYDYGYNYGYPTRTIDVGRDRLVRDFAVTETDNWVRDQTTLRGTPRYRYGTSYGAWPRRVISSGIGGPRTSSLRTGGDLLYMKR